MASVVRMWRTWKHGRKFAKKGRHCRFPAKYLEVDGHVEIGNYCRFRNNVVLRTHDNGKIVFGDRSGCSYFCIIEAAELVQIGMGTGIAEHTVIRDTNHMVYGTNINWRLTPHITKPVIIGDHVLIGSHCYISPGVTIGDGAVVGACSFVTKDIGPYEIWAGNPARRVAHRTKDLSQKQLEESQRLIQKYGISTDRYTGIGEGHFKEENTRSDNDEEIDPSNNV